MINLNFKQLEEPIKIRHATFLIIENKDLYVNLIADMNQYGENNRITLFDAKYNEMKSTELMLISDVFGYNLNSLTVLKSIYKDIENQLNDELEAKSSLDRLSIEISHIIEETLVNHDLNLEYDEITIMELLSSLGIKIEQHNMDILSKTEDIINVFKYLSRKKILIFNNIGLYLNDRKWQSIIELISLSDIDVLFIETNNNEFNNRYVVDDDFYISQDI